MVTQGLGKQTVSNMPWVACLWNSMTMVCSWTPLEWNSPSSRFKPIEGGGRPNDKLDPLLGSPALGYEKTTEEHLLLTSSIRWWSLAGGIVKEIHPTKQPM